MFTRGTHAKGVDLLVLYSSAAVPQIKVRKDVCCRGNLSIPWFPAARVGAMHLDAVLAAALQNSSKSDCAHMMTDLHLAHRQGA